VNDETRVWLAWTEAQGDPRHKGPEQDEASLPMDDFRKLIALARAGCELASGGYAKHRSHCNVVNFAIKSNCTCGLEKALSAFHAASQT
jgi:hypothetical protein